MEIFTEIGGRTGIDCGGFCEFCFYKNINFNDLKPTGCINCPPEQIGCKYCQNIIDRVSMPFKPISTYLIDLYKIMRNYNGGSLDYKDLQIIITGGADILNYPHLFELISILKKSNFNLHLGYTSGKPIKNENMANKIILSGVNEVSFSVFSTDSNIRKKWMNDGNADVSIKGLKSFCESIDLNASAVIIPGVNDGDELLQTCANLEDWGAKSFTLRRFANFKSQGLILNNNPIIKGINPHSYEEFKDLVQKISNDFSFRVLAFPFYDPGMGIPFLILRKENKNYLDKLNEVKSEATIITSEFAAPYLIKIFDIVDKSNLINIVTTNKEIADLIVHKDLESIDLNELKSKVIVPGGALIHRKYSEKLLNKDGTYRKIIRGPYVLTNPYIGEDSQINKEELIEFEIKAFNKLIDKINNH